MKTLAIGVLIGLVLVGLRLPSPLPPGPAPLPLPVPTPVVPTPVPVPNPGPVVPASTFLDLGRNYRDPFVATRAASWKGIATQIRAGIAIPDAIKAGDEDFTARRRSIFTSSIAPALDKLGPSQPADIANAFDELANGISKP
jgi:hypothetical protein